MVCQYLLKITNQDYCIILKEEDIEVFLLTDQTKYGIGYPNSSEDIKQAHAAAIEYYIETHVGKLENEHGDMYFQRTLEDWAKFNINNRTKHDASISSGLAVMACNKNKYRPVAEVSLSKKINLGIRRYNNEGSNSQII